MYCPKRDIGEVRRIVRWVLDCNKTTETLADCFTVLSQAHEILRNIEMKCVSQKNHPMNSCIFNQE